MHQESYPLPGNNQPKLHGGGFSKRRQVTDDITIYCLWATKTIADYENTTFGAYIKMQVPHKCEWFNETQIKNILGLTFPFSSLSGSWTNAKKEPKILPISWTAVTQTHNPTWEAESQRSWVWGQPGQYSKISVSVKQNVTLGFWGLFIKKMKGKLFQLQIKYLLGQVSSWCLLFYREVGFGLQWPSEASQLTSSRLKASNKLEQVLGPPRGLISKWIAGFPPKADSTDCRLACPSRT